MPVIVWSNMQKIISVDEIVKRAQEAFPGKTLGEMFFKLERCCPTDASECKELILFATLDKEDCKRKK